MKIREKKTDYIITINVTKLKQTNYEIIQTLYFSAVFDIQNLDNSYLKVGSHSLILIYAQTYYLLLFLGRFYNLERSAVSRHELLLLENILYTIISI